MKIKYESWYEYQIIDPNRLAGLESPKIRVFYIIGAFIGERLIGSAGLYCLNLLKSKHRGVLWGIYIKPEHKKKGIADSLVETLIYHAKSHVIQLHLNCVTNCRYRNNHL
jgi:N-acetylglutamate synthase-like GNAT family acetyltransferase